MPALTQNQPQLRDQVTEMFTYERGADFRNCAKIFYEAIEKGYGRIEIISC